MTEERTRFETEVPGIWGLWPLTPPHWSYSSLKAIEACPSQWMLSRADFPDLWDRHGYPALPVVPAIFGNVVHGVVERLARELGAAGVESPDTGDAVGILRSLGGWRTIVLDGIERQLARFRDNPRVSAEQVDRLREELIRRAPEAADQAKVFLGRGTFPSVSEIGISAVGGTSALGGPVPRRPVGSGAHAELEVVAEAMRLTGRIDLLVVDDAQVSIVDFKTGAESQDRGDQVRLYALLWYLDAQVNPDRKLATELHVVYPAGEQAIETPDRAELQSLEDATSARVQAADTVTQQPPPTANPIEENCRYCSVRHLCDAYWSALPPAVTAVSTGQWFDFEGRILRQNGSKSWFAETLAQPPAQVLVRTVETDVAFQAGRRVRLLGVRRSQDPDDPDRLVISMVGTSEWYPLGS
ncbi:MAG: PD-(D/E)XK nuclease family protein [Propionibacteriaceae bacterium]|nr:PD-(D/E)XK nuclease family protein [Propionibacteriaceae bacterium]